MKRVCILTPEGGRKSQKGCYGMIFIDETNHCGLLNCSPQGIPLLEAKGLLIVVSKTYSEEYFIWEENSTIEDVLIQHFS